MLSPRAQIREQEFRLGGASNAAANVVKLGADALLIGIVGADSEAEALKVAAVADLDNP